MTIFSFVNALSDIAICVVPFFLRKKYPHAANHAGFKMPIWSVFGLSAFAFCVAAYLAYSMLLTLDKMVWILIFGFIAIFLIYVVIRVAYLKSKGRYLMEELREPHQPWEDREAECIKMDEAK